MSESSQASGADAPLITVEVAYALPEKQAIISMKRPPPLTAREAILDSGILDEFPGIDLTTTPLGVFGKPCTQDTLLREGDRVELYRPLVNDPREARRNRASGQPGRNRAVTPRPHR